MYLANPCSSAAVLDAMKAGQLGFIDTPRQRNRRPAGVAWCADNGAFSAKFDPKKWWDFLLKHAHEATDCMFVTAPDVVGDAAATYARSAPWLPLIRALGYRVAYVAQDGLEHLPVPWDAFEVLFIGGTTDWKLGEHAATLIREAKARGKWVHFGRVNSRKRYDYAQSLGCDSCDGTFLTFGPDKNLPRLLSWLEDAS